MFFGKYENYVTKKSRIIRDFNDKLKVNLTYFLIIF